MILKQQLKRWCMAGLRRLAGGTMAGEGRRKQRLILCLDGTWNQRDSGTNIYHLSNLIEEGVVEGGGETWRQRVYYQQGVGTGLLDSVTGGAFGFGLSRNVRHAYDWLVEHYCDEDEIYVFGFSRGAFTARSLVGLIAKCGLLRRGAPIPPEELWHAYQILGRHCDERTGMEPAPNWWERIAGKQKPPFRELQVLRREAWEKSSRLRLHRPANRAEELLITWSRRVPIYCVGVFDTVGALGIDSLAIPWLRDSTAQFHDARLNTLVVNGFQALAVDEHRASFSHIPWYRETGSGIPADQTVNGERLEQRWFVGAHSDMAAASRTTSSRSLRWPGWSRRLANWVSNFSRPIQTRRSPCPAPGTCPCRSRHPAGRASPIRLRRSAIPSASSRAVSGSTSSAPSASTAAWVRRPSCRTARWSRA